MIKIKNAAYQIPDFSLKIDVKGEVGKFYTVLGPSGAGKSTLLSVIAGFEQVKSGTIFLDGKNMQGVAPALRPVSMVFQEHNTFAHLTVWENVVLGISPSLKLSSSDAGKVRDALQKVGLQNYAERTPTELSGGERQRVVLARVLVRNKPILLLDEPFAALDPALRQVMLDLVLKLQREQQLTVLLVTHQPQDALHAADKVIFVDNGQVHPALQTKEFFASRQASIMDYLGRPR